VCVRRKQLVPLTLRSSASLVPLGIFAGCVPPPLTRPLLCLLLPLLSLASLLHLQVCGCVCCPCRVDRSLTLPGPLVSPACLSSYFCLLLCDPLFPGVGSDSEDYL
jgi:hypothetical protein